MLNAAKFVLSFPVPEGAQVTLALDASMLTALDGVVTEATKAFDRYDAARALELTEAFFWTFCDDYLELVKERAYNQADVGQASAALSPALGPLDAPPPAGAGALLRHRGIVVVVRRRIRAHGGVAHAARHRRRPGRARCRE